MNSTLGILRAATKVPSVKRILTLSSAAAVYETTSVGPNTWDESNWNVADVEAVKKEGRAASQRAKYFASKTLAEQSAWAFYREQKEKEAQEKRRGEIHVAELWKPFGTTVPLFVAAEKE